MRNSNKEIVRKSKKIFEFEKKAIKGKKLWPTYEKIFSVLSGNKSIVLDKSERAFIAYAKNFFSNYAERVNLKNTRKYYVPHIEQQLMERIARRGVKGALTSYLEENVKLNKKGEVPTDILLALDNIMGSNKFFKFALERKGGLDPSIRIST